MKTILRLVISCCSKCGNSTVLFDHIEGNEAKFVCLRCRHTWSIKFEPARSDHSFCVKTIAELDQVVRLSSLKAVALLAYERGYRDAERGFPFEAGRKNVEDIFNRA